MMIEVLHYLLTAGIFWGFFCRATRMDAGTSGWVKLQHAVLLLGAMCSLPFVRQHIGLSIGQEWDVIGLGAGVLGYLALETRRAHRSSAVWLES